MNTRWALPLGDLRTKVPSDVTAPDPTGLKQKTSVDTDLYSGFSLMGYEEPTSGASR